MFLNKLIPTTYVNSDSEVGEMAYKAAKKITEEVNQVDWSKTDAVGDPQD